MFSIHEIAKLPKHHEARTNPDLKVARHDVVELDLEILTSYPLAKRIKLLFGI